MKNSYLHIVSRIILTVTIAIAVGSCNEESPGLPTMALIASCSPSRTTIIEHYQLTDIPPLFVGAPPSTRPWDYDDDALVQELARVDGRALIAIKAPASRGLLETGGERAALSAAQFADGICVLEKSGVEITTVLRSIGLVNVRIDPALGLELRANPVVDYIEPDMVYKYGGTVLPVGAEG